MKNVVIVAPHFPPSNLASVHRSRYFAMHLREFGWQARVLSVDSAYYEEELDPELEQLVPSDVEVIRTKALPTFPVRVIGDISIRSFWWQYRALCRLLKKERIDLVYIPIPPNYSAMLGPLVHRKFGVPYAIDYIDPWVNTWPGCEVLFSKAWCSYHLGRLLEPIALRKVSLLTAVAPGYYEGALNRYPWLDSSHCFAMPYGSEEADFRYLDEHPRPPYLFDPSDGNFHFVYAGAMLPKAYSPLKALFQALVEIGKEDQGLVEKLRVHFIGTGSAPTDLGSFMIRPLAESYGLSEIILESPARIPYLDVLNHLKHAHAVLILGSTEPHYTPSKAFQAVLSGRPVLALLHAKSTAVDILNRSRAGRVVTFDENRSVGEQIDEIAQAIGSTIDRPYSKPEVNWEIFGSYSAKSMTERLVQAFDFALVPE